MLGGAAAIRRRAHPGSVLPAALLLLGAAAVGALATIQVALAAAAVAAVAVAVVVAWDVASLPYLLVFTMFVESLSLGPGLRVGRLAGGLALLVLFVTLLTRGRGGLRWSPLLATALAYGLWMVSSIFWALSPSTVPAQTFSYLLSGAYMLTFAVLVRAPEQLHRIARTLAFGSAVFGLVAFAYFARHTASAASANDVSGRAAGLQGDPNYFAVYQVVALPATLILAAYARDTWRRLVYYGIIGVIVLSVVSSLSRTGLLAMTAAVLLTMVLPWRIFFHRRGQKATYFVALLAAAAIAGVAGSAQLVQRFQTILDPNAAGSYRGAGRQDLWRAALHGWRANNELLGMGSGNFRFYSLDLLQATPGVDTTQNYVRPNREVHNAYLENLVDLGIVGLTLFVSLLALTARSLVVTFRRARVAGDLVVQRFALGFLVSLTGYTVSGFFLSNQLAKVVWILVGLALALDTISRRALLAAPVAVPEPAYDEDVRQRLLEQREQEIERLFQAAIADQRRIDRRRDAIDEREREAREQAEAVELERRRLEQLEEALLSREGVLPGLEQGEARSPTLEDELARQAAELLAREQELAARLEQREAVLQDGEAGVAARLEQLEEREQELAARLEQLEEREELFDRRLMLVVERETSTARLYAQLAHERKALEEREAAWSRTAEARPPETVAPAGVEPPEPETPVAAPPQPPAPASPLEPVIEPEPEPAPLEPEVVEPELELPEPQVVAPEPFVPALRVLPAAGAFDLTHIQQLVDRRRDEFPDRVEEWRYYLLFLREHADLDGHLPPAFDALVADVFDELFER